MQIPERKNPAVSEIDFAKMIDDLFFEADKLSLATGKWSETKQ